MESKHETTHWVRIYLSGPLPVIEQTCRDYCYAVGLCVTVDATLFIYTGGEERGAVVGLVNYPRFPTTGQQLWAKARDLAELLVMATHQRSALIVDPHYTEWITREQDKP